MITPNHTFPRSSVTLSEMISEAVYKAVVGVGKIIHLMTK